MPKIERNYFKDVGFVYKFWFKVFGFLNSISPFALCKKMLQRKFSVGKFPEVWVIVHTCLSISLTVVSSIVNIRNFLGFVVIYALVRIAEILVYQINVLLFDPYRTLVIKGEKSYKLKNPYRTVILLGHNFIEIIFWFTLATDFIWPSGESLLIRLMDNTIRVFTFNYEKVAGISENLQVLLFFEVMAGLLLTIVSLAKFIGEIPHGDIEVEESSMG